MRKNRSESASSPASDAHPFWQKKRLTLERIPGLILLLAKGERHAAGRTGTTNWREHGYAAALRTPWPAADTAANQRRLSQLFTRGVGTSEPDPARPERGLIPTRSESDSEDPRPGRSSLPECSQIGGCQTSSTGTANRGASGHAGSTSTCSAFLEQASGPHATRGTGQITRISAARISTASFSGSIDRQISQHQKEGAP